MAAAFGVPDQEIPGSERVMAVVQLKEDSKDTVGEQQIIQFCREKLPPYAIPMGIEIRTELPLTVTEKVFKRVLRDETIERLSIESR
jgi:long-chain acyl-CoA synthetase